MYKTLAVAARRQVLVVGLAAACWSAPAAQAAVRAPETFTTPDKAVVAFVAASRKNDRAELFRIFGPAGRDLIVSGDRIADKEARAHFVDRYGQASKIVPDGADKATLVIGTEEWPFPIPIVQKGGVWHFDAQAGLQEILNRRIGRNELNAIEVCRGYVQAQRDYAADLAGQNGSPIYARKFVSSAGQHDGLYWPVRAGEKESPIGPQMASARAEGYDGAADRKNPHAPYHGYYYKILTRQGAAAPGGARDYVVDGRLTGGFALIAFPAKYGDSGVMTFIVDQAGIVYEKDLGPKTAAVASAITAYDPDLTWKTR